ncbi:MAG: hypothetical protein K2K29_03070 [Muribaculaceae bacterium]|nr:hypothetical protein [Muribaculaceae bacterium]
MLTRAGDECPEMADGFAAAAGALLPSVTLQTNQIPPSPPFPLRLCVRFPSA